jgi:hypothetical protein
MEKKESSNLEKRPVVVFQYKFGQTDYLFFSNEEKKA